jgi:hypothetical protein
MPSSNGSYSSSHLFLITYFFAVSRIPDIGEKNRINIDEILHKQANKSVTSQACHPSQVPYIAKIRPECAQTSVHTTFDCARSTLQLLDDIPVPPNTATTSTGSVSIQQTAITTEAATSQQQAVSNKKKSTALASIPSHFHMY